MARSFPVPPTRARHAGLWLGAGVLAALAAAAAIFALRPAALPGAPSVRDALAATATMASRGLLGSAPSAPEPVPSSPVSATGGPPDAGPRVGVGTGDSAVKHRKAAFGASR